MESLSEILDNAEEIVGVVEQDVVIAGVRSIDGQSGELTTKTINNESILGTGNIALATTSELAAETEARVQADNTLQGNIDAKQDKLNSTQLLAVNSGIDSTLVTQITTNQHDITTINDKIPAQASSTNKLADKDFVNSSISTETANYISNNGQPFTSVEQLEAYTGTVTDNDYAFVTGTDSAGNTYYDRYKATVHGQEVTWAKEYRLNNSSFTSDQWAAINSGISISLTEQITTNKNNIATLTSGKQDKLSSSQLEAVDSGITSTKVTKLDGIEAGAEVNVIETVKVNGTALTPDAQRAVDVAVPFVPDDFFTGAATITGEGTAITIENALAAPLKDAKLKGNTTQTTISGKNQFNIETLAQGSITVTDGVATGTAGQFYTEFQNGITLANTPAVASITVTAYHGGTTSSGNGITFRAIYSDASAENLVIFPNDTTVATTKTGTTDPSKTLDKLAIVYGSGSSNTWHISQVQVEAGTTPTAWEQFCGGTESPNPDYPQTVNNVTGTQTITLNSADYQVRLGDLELCGIGSYKDFLYKSNNSWYKHAAIGKTILTGSSDETWSTGGNNAYAYHTIDNAYQPANRNTIAAILSNCFVPNTYNKVASTTIDYGVALDSDNAGRLAIRNKDHPTASSLKTWLSAHNTTVYYALATATDTKITDADLIADLEAVVSARLAEGQNTITSTGVAPNLDAILTVEAFQNNWSGTIGGIEAQIGGVESTLNLINNGGNA